ncbi:hypothetical protein NA57DRAFT_77134 [Rhizodiscina lignyota]|uniref:Zn(2)-C6 fungal-type domain-containing protein n=1 Tax=Rhizodiscina lignyota TaxID=1504668 RepID=A0A9P4IFT8_9PEZI|nr:hypothetical protein NA57DRAFT_77134 [Rhizodiscina lignyota]
MATESKANGDSGRPTVSCTECQRRKQKCSREWPCNHCQARKVAHLCHFGPKKAGGSEKAPADITLDAKTRKRDADETEEEQKAGIAPLGGIGDQGDGLKAWGYDPSHYNYNLGTLVSEMTLQGATTAPGHYTAAITEALKAFPPRFLTDALVQNYVRIQIYHYNPIYAPTFLEDYSQWWKDRASGEELSPAFTCLLLRVCACSAQYLNPSIKEKLVYELVASPQDLTEKYDKAAVKLSGTIIPGTGGLVQVQQLFLVASWMKSEGLLVESWHALCNAIREAQEIGLHKELPPGAATEFDLEMRERIWCLLYVWDWQMSKWLSRPRIVDYNGCAFHLPNLRIDQSDATPGLPSPFEHVRRQGQLVRILDSEVKRIGAVYAEEEIYNIQNKIDRWIIEFLPPHAFVEPDTKWDNDFPYVASQRYQLHSIGYMLKLDPVRSYLTKYIDVSKDKTAVDFRELALDCCFKINVAARKSFELERATNAKAHLFAFSHFDVATILCSALAHDKDKTLPRREEILDTIKVALDTLSELGKITKIGAISYGFLAKLVNALNVLDEEVPLSDPSSTKRSKTEALPANAEQDRVNISEEANSSVTGFGTTVVNNTSTEEQQPLSTPLSPNEWQFALEQQLTATNFDTFLESVDLNSLEPGWPDWETVTFDVPPGPN